MIIYNKYYILSCCCIMSQQTSKNKVNYLFKLLFKKTMFVRKNTKEKI